ncbi:MAG TPA: hypothetical protein VGH28_00940 [Polyangiaceae bacterium]|jgi:hypothetical protein
MRRAWLWVAAAVVACGGGTDQFGGDGGNADGSSGDSSSAQDGAVTFGDSGTTDSSAPKPDASGPEVDYVYAHSPSELYKVDPVKKTMTTVGTFSGQCLFEEVIDIAVDANNNGYATTFSGFYKLDLSTAACTLISSGSYPNSLSFVPAGTLDPNVEALVGYVGATYVRIDPAKGTVTNVGALKGGYSSSGDIVSVKGGGTFLTVTGNSCGDCLLQVDPKTGDMIQNYGSINHGSVFGLAFWAGTAYGFDDSGQLFSIGWVNNKLVTTDIPTTPGLEFWGAGSTTSAPATDADGGGIPVN